jgi:hypothetical protein
MQKTNYLIQKENKKFPTLMERYKGVIFRDVGSYFKSGQASPDGNSYKNDEY